MPTANAITNAAGGHLMFLNGTDKLSNENANKQKQGAWDVSMAHWSKANTLVELMNTTHFHLLAGYLTDSLLYPMHTRCRAGSSGRIREISIFNNKGYVIKRFRSDAYKIYERK